MYRRYGWLMTAGLAACAQTPAPPPGLVGHAWQVQRALDTPVANGSAVRLAFQADGRVTGSASCNTLSGRYVRDGDKLQFGPIVTTRIACAPALMTQEAKVIGALERTTVARVRPDGLLELRDAQGAELLRGAPAAMVAGP